jgi:hypothetical protein
MIVTCENCNTRFNLDENLIKESGSKPDQGIRLQGQMFQMPSHIYRP